MLAMIVPLHDGRRSLGRTHLLRNPLVSLVRRGSDLLVAATALLVAAPVLLVVLVLLRTKNGGLVLARDVHEGGNGRPGGWWRFHPAQQGGSAAGVATWLRRSRLDRLPRLLNVLAGEATLFSPRRTPAPAHAPLALIDTPAFGRTAYGLGVRLVSLVITRIVPYRWAVVILTHVALVAIGYRLALELRFDFALGPMETMLYWQTLPLLLVPRLLSYWYFGLDRGYWKHFGVEDLSTLCKAAAVGSVGFLGGLYLTGLLGALPRSVWLLEATATIGLAGGVRLLARSLLDLRMPGGPTRRAFVIGVGNKAERVLREVRRDHSNVVEVVGVIADTVESKNRSLHGVTILGTVDELEGLVQRCRVTMLIVALDAPSSEQMQRILGRCLETGVEFRILPSLHELLQGADRIAQLRRVRIEDKLGGETRRAGPGVRALGVAGQGGADHGRRGFHRIGAGPPDRPLAPAKLVLLDRAESPLYFIVLEIARAHAGLELVPVVCDMTDEAGWHRCSPITSRTACIHAAAYKHVPMLESNVVEAVTTTSWEPCSPYGRGDVGRRAVHPDLHRQGGQPRRASWAPPSASRSGWCSDCRGRATASSIRRRPLRERAGLRRQRGPAVRAADRRRRAGDGHASGSRRYFMTIPEAAHLVLQAGNAAGGGGADQHARHGSPGTHLDLAEKLIRLSGQEPYRDIGIAFTGLRPGEKLTEELMSAVEATVPTTSGRSASCRPRRNRNAP